MKHLKQLCLLCLFMADSAWALAIPNNTIYYTSSTEAIVEPGNSDVFGANLVSNTYKNGQGILTFDKDITTIGNFAFNRCSDLTSIKVSSDNPVFDSREN
jgi:hypothetical protein